MTKHNKEDPYDQCMQWVGTKDTKSYLTKRAGILGVSRAAVIREAVELYRQVYESPLEDRRAIVSVVYED